MEGQHEALGEQFREWSRSGVGEGEVGARPFTRYNCRAVPMALLLAGRAVHLPMAPSTAAEEGVPAVGGSQLGAQNSQLRLPVRSPVSPYDLDPTQATAAPPPEEVIQGDLDLASRQDELDLVNSVIYEQCDVSLSFQDAVFEEDGDRVGYFSLDLPATSLDSAFSSNAPLPQLSISGFQPEKPKDPAPLRLSPQTSPRHPTPAASTSTAHRSGAPTLNPSPQPGPSSATSTPHSSGAPTLSSSPQPGPSSAASIPYSSSAPTLGFSPQPGPSFAISPDGGAALDDSSSSTVTGSDSPLSKRARHSSVSEEQKDAAYWEKRRKNNESAKRSREARRAKEQQITFQVAVLERRKMSLKAHYEFLRQQNAKLEEQVIKYRQVDALLMSRHDLL